MREDGDARRYRRTRRSPSASRFLGPHFPGAWSQGPKPWLIVQNPTCWTTTSRATYTPTSHGVQPAHAEPVPSRSRIRATIPLLKGLYGWEVVPLLLPTAQRGRIGYDHSAKCWSWGTSSMAELTCACFGIARWKARGRANCAAICPAPRCRADKLPASSRTKRRRETSMTKPRSKQILLIERRDDIGAHCRSRRYRRHDPGTHAREMPPRGAGFGAPAC